LTAAWPCASVAKVAALSGPGGPVVKNSTQSTSRRSYSLNTSGKWTSMPRAQPNRTPPVHRADYGPQLEIPGELRGRVSGTVTWAAANLMRVVSGMVSPI
jgi:hypothetical protein